MHPGCCLSGLPTWVVMALHAPHFTLYLPQPNLCSVAVCVWRRGTGTELEAARGTVKPGEMGRRATGGRVPRNLTSFIALADGRFPCLRKVCF